MSENIVIELVAKEKTYSNKEIAALLGIGLSTLRKWSALLEQSGYSFPRDGRSRREYRQMDAIALRKMKELTKENAMSLEDAAMTVASSMQRPPAMPDQKLPAATSLIQRSPRSYEALEQKVDSLVEHIQKQDAFNLALLERLDKQEKYISINLKERDRRLTKAMNDILETKVAMAALQDSQRKKSIWHRLFTIR